MKQLKGIDISAHQLPKDIDYDQIAQQIDFAILRVGYTGSGDNPPYTNNFNKDKHFETHYGELQKRGVNIGVYYYGGAVTEQEVTQELEIVKNALKDKEITYPVYYDVEETRNHGTLFKQKLSQLVTSWCEQIEKLGYYTGIYASMYWFTSKLGELDRFDKWLTYWSERTEAIEKFKHGLWQYTGTEQLKGYRGHLNLNISFKDYPQIIKTNKLDNLDLESLDQYSDHQLADMVWDEVFEDEEEKKEKLGQRYHGVQRLVKQQAKEKTEIIIGSVVQIKDGARSYEGSKMDNWVYKKIFIVYDVKGLRIFLDKNGINTAFRREDLMLIKQ